MTGLSHTVRPTSELGRFGRKPELLIQVHAKREPGRLFVVVRSERHGAAGDRGGAGGAGAAERDLDGHPDAPAALAAERRGVDRAGRIALGKSRRVRRARIEMHKQHVEVRQRLRVLILDGKVPDFELRRVARVQLTGVEALRDRRLLQRGVHLTEYIGLGFLRPVVFRAGILHALPDGRPLGRSALAGVQVEHQQRAVHRLACRCVECQICHFVLSFLFWFLRFGRHKFALWAPQVRPLGELG